jgi:hypothetical protein
MHATHAIGTEMVCDDFSYMHANNSLAIPSLIAIKK